MEITYKECNGYLIPDLEVPNKKYNIGKYGQLHKDYIKEHHRSLYSKMLIDGTLLDYLENIDNTARNEVERLVAAISEKEGVNEKLKAENQMKWVGLKNAIKHSAEEIVNNNIVYSINFAFGFGNKY